MSTRVYRRMPVPSTPSPMTATWPGKIERVSKNVESKSKRPETATLEKPMLLDPKLLRKLDMTTLCRDKLLTIENLIISPRTDLGKIARDKESCSIGEPKTKRISRGLNTTYRIRSNGRKRLADVFAASPTIPNTAPPTIASPIEAEPREQSLVKRATKIPGKRSPAYHKEKGKIDVKALRTVKEAIITESVPPPCCTCGRPEQPERLHSHPVRGQVKKTKVPRAVEHENIPSPSQSQPKSSVRKPNAIKYRSNKTTPPEPIQETAKQSPLARKSTFRIDSKKAEPISKLPDSPSKSPKLSQIPISRRLPKRTSFIVPKTPPPFVPTLTPVQHSPPSTSPSKGDQGDRTSTSPLSASSPSPSPRRPRTVVCYLCMREFGTASLPLHEPHCLQKWERDNAALPAHLRRAPPQRPDRALSPSEWNKFAYETAQAALAPCDKCGRTFLPHRLPLHMKACLGIKRSSNATAPITTVKDCKSIDENKERCFICGSTVMPEDMANHEEECLARWQTENDKLPAHVRQPLPAKPGEEAKQGQVIQKSEAEGPCDVRQSPQASPRRRLSVCWLCGREFGSASIRIHEPRCLQRWRLENEQLPPERRRPEPQKPTVVLTSDGKVDQAATDEVFWKSHLVQLVPCTKCNRTFNPDRVVVHEKSCKGPVNKH